MSLSIGIVGLPNVGKSTLFKALTNKQIDIQNYPFTTIDPNVGVVAVPDERVDQLAEFSHSKKKIYTTIEFIDIAGLVKGAAEGEGLGNKFLANIREVDAIAQIVRAFEDAPAGGITHVYNRVNPAEDIGIINTELILADLETLSKRKQNTLKKSKSDKKEAEEISLLDNFESILNAGNLLNSYDRTGVAHNEKALTLMKELNLLTAKQFIYVINISEQQLLGGFQLDTSLKEALDNASYVVMCNKLELALSEVSDPTEKEAFLKEFQLPESGLDQLIKEGYRSLGLLTFLTTGEDETRAWTAHIGDPMPRAARAIHTDFEKLFIRADVINWKVLLESGGWNIARGKGLIKTVGRDHIIQEGDVIEIKI